MSYFFYLLLFLFAKDIKEYLIKRKQRSRLRVRKNKVGYTATQVACGWAGAVLEKVTRASGQEPYAQKAQKRSKKGTNRPTNRPTDTAGCRLAEHATKNP